MVIKITNSSQVLISNIFTSSLVNPLTSGITITTWLKKENWIEGGGIKSIIGIYEVSASGGIQLEINQTANSVTFWNWGGTDLVSYPSSSLVSGQFYFLAYTWDGTNSRFYINGNLVDTTTVSPQNTSFNRTQVNSYPAIAPFSISNNELSNDFEIDDFRVYKRTLSKEEIETIYYSFGKDQIVHELVLHYMFDSLPISTPVSVIYNIVEPSFFMINLTAQPSFDIKLIHNIK